ncbi:hypothetical protein [Rhodoblastus sp.]|uniref:hypothetical protein n=1 Tax=Rhodoblastus sp. TaxID=1962975 RepID=UPI003F968B65
MSKAAASIKYFSYYMFGVGLILLFAPNFLLAIFGFPETEEVWIRVVGLLAFLIGVYYFVAAREGLRVFFLWTVPTRISVFVVFTAFVLLGLVKPMLMLFGVIDLVGATWTYFALRRGDAKAV